MTTNGQLSIDLQRALCAVNRTVFKLASAGRWTAPARGASDLVLADPQVSELRRQGLIDMLPNSVLVPTEPGRLAYRECAAQGHSCHMAR